jgi:hypothetical protein
MLTGVVVGWGGVEWKRAGSGGCCLPFCSFFSFLSACSLSFPFWFIFSFLGVGGDVIFATKMKRGRVVIPDSARMYFRKEKSKQNARLTLQSQELESKKARKRPSNKKLWQLSSVVAPPVGQFCGLQFYIPPSNAPRRAVCLL